MVEQLTCDRNSEPSTNKSDQIIEDEMGVRIARKWAFRNTYKMIRKLKKKDQFEIIGIDRRIKLKRTFKKQSARVVSAGSE